MYNPLTSQKNRFRTLILTAVLTLSLLAGPLLGFLPPASDFVYGATHYLEIKKIGGSSATQGESDVSIQFEITNMEDNQFVFNEASLIFDPAEGITVTGSSGSLVTLLSKGNSTVVTFNLKLARFAETGYRSHKLVLGYNGDTIHEYQVGGLQIYESLAAPSGGTGKYVASVDISHQLTPSDGFVTGSGNTITFEVFNKGNTVIKDAVMSLTLPEGLSIYNDSNSINMGYISTASRKKVSFPIYISDKAETKNYPIEVKLSGLDYSNNEVSTTKSFFIPVSGTGGGSLQKVAIEAINAPAQVEANKDFTLSFNVKNSGTAAVNDLLISVEPEEGLLNKSQAVFSEKSIGAGQSKNYTVTLFAKAGDSRNIPVKMKVESQGGSGQNVVQYTGVYVGGDGSGVKTPQLMVSNYNFGGEFVEAGSGFGLYLTLFNTSPKKLSNVKVKLDSGDGTFTPLGSSNSFYVDEIPAKSTYTKKIDLSVKPMAEQKTTPINVSMSYEDGSANGYTAEEVIAIPVMQENRLMVEDILPPYELYIGQQTSAEVKFFNMGKSVISNLKIDVSGDFDTFESNSYYVGNMEAGRSDSYSFSFAPRQAGPVSGMVTFSFEDAAGAPQTIEVPFEFTAMEMPIFEEPGFEEPEKATPIKPILIGVGILAAITAAVLFRRHRKKKLHARMQLADEAFSDQLDQNRETEE